MSNKFSLKRRLVDGNTPELSDWGLNSEYGVLRDVLLAKPTNLKQLSTSSITRKYFKSDPCNIDIAKEQFAELLAAYEDCGVKVHYVIEDEHLPMQLYTRDSSFMTPYGAVITNMSMPVRRGENFLAIQTYEQLGIPIYDYVTAGTFEGGDFNVIEPGCVLIGCGEERTEEVAAKQVQSWFEKEGWDTYITYFDPYFVHIDLMVVMLAEKLVALCLECTDPEVVKWLKGKNIEIIPVPFQDTIKLGCNVMALGNDRVIAPSHSQSLVLQLRARGFEVTEVNTAEISKTGGGIHCMAQALRRDRS